MRHEAAPTQRPRKAAVSGIRQRSSPNARRNHRQRPRLWRLPALKATGHSCATDRPRAERVASSRFGLMKPTRAWIGSPGSDSTHTRTTCRSGTGGRSFIHGEQAPHAREGPRSRGDPDALASHAMIVRSSHAPAKAAEFTRALQVPASAETHRLQSVCFIHGLCQPMNASTTLHHAHRRPAVTTSPQFR